MYSNSSGTQAGTLPPAKAAHQPHIAGALRQFADGEQLNEIAIAAKFNRPQMLRNKLLLNQPHQLSIHEAVDIAKASGNRCIIDGMLLELGCAPSIAIDDLNQCERMSLTDRALEISANAGWLGNMALDVKARRGGVTERMRHEAVKRASRAMSELALFMHDVEQKFQAIPVLSVAFDAVQNLPMPGAM
ncbi:phage regulatory CII family protein [Shewanella baltica]|uniref:Phage regulatory CII family protein n=1 Tax=Shewanella baltica (strain OS155 / ATCC BAA-1091) TaxID=325240 RepID=A3D226_SHEB5|nr:phage regulatory CII family protein [Shewanella baltica]ABN60789.1 phage regulatory CII family protein [Shewanella baltica OS155]AEH13135.1 regulatory CII family protein [Shewanella baltica OS117]